MSSSARKGNYLAKPELSTFNQTFLVCSFSGCKNPLLLFGGLFSPASYVYMCIYTTALVPSLPNFPLLTCSRNVLGLIEQVILARSSSITAARRRKNPAAAVANRSVVVDPSRIPTIRVLTSDLLTQASERPL